MLELSPLTPLLAIGFGLLSFVSPCCLPLLPAYLGLIAGSTADADMNRWILWWRGVAFVLGLALVFAFMGASASLVGSVLLTERVPLMQLGGVLIVIFGLQSLGVLRFGWLARTYLPLDASRLSTAGGPLGAFLVGAAFSIGWTPCIGVFLGSLLSLAAQEDTIAQGTFLLFLYGLGLGVPFLAAAVGANRALRWSRSLRPHLGIIERAGGVVLVVMGALLLTGQLTLINVWAIRTFGLGWAF